MKKLLTTRSITLAAAIAALYAALTLLLSPISYGDWQCRVSEALTMLPMLVPQAIPGLFVGCVLANLLGPSAGVTDIVFGSLATLIAALGTWYFRKNKWLAAACPIVANGVIVGLVLSLSFNLPFPLTALQVAAGEAVAVLLGLALIKALERVDLEKLTR
ncbi:MAG: QueT transporter family protein [Clostridia bacterium]|nr:QueT transporter family protein [Clostridia bacterium]